jgi:hypothetical protein
MNLKNIIAIAGKPGLFKVLAQGKQSIIVESLIDNKRSAANASNKISTLEDISIYAEDEDVLLSEVFKKIYEKENGGPCISHKASEDEQRAYFAEVLPNYSRDRVYLSDIRKIFNWYNMLHNAGLLILSEEENKEPDTGEEKTKNEKKTAVKTAPKTSMAKTMTPKASTANSKAPVKKPTVQRKSS